MLGEHTYKFFSFLDFSIMRKVYISEFSYYKNEKMRIMEVIPMMTGKKLELKMLKHKITDRGPPIMT